MYFLYSFQCYYFLPVRLMFIVYTLHSPGSSCSLSWPALLYPGPSWQGYYPKLTVVPPPPPTPHSTFRVVVAVDGFWVGVFIFFLTLTKLISKCPLHIWRDSILFNSANVSPGNHYQYHRQYIFKSNWSE